MTKYWVFGINCYQEGVIIAVDVYGEDFLGVAGLLAFEYYALMLARITIE